MKVRELIDALGRRWPDLRSHPESEGREFESLPDRWNKPLLYKSFSSKMGRLPRSFLAARKGTNRVDSGTFGQEVAEYPEECSPFERA